VSRDPEYDRLVDEARAKLDGNVGEAKRRGQAKAGSRIALEEVEPWPEPVDGLELANEIRAVIRRHVVLDETASLAVALWAMLTWVYESSRVLPILAVSSPTPECGKTTLLELLGELVQRAVPGSNITPAATYRVIEAARPTLLIDEADTFLGGNDELRGVINSGHTRATAFVLRSVGDGAKQEVRKFSTWCPKAIAVIRELPETITRRSIGIRLERKLPSEEVEYLAAGDGRYRGLRRRLARWAEDNEDAAGRKVDLLPMLSNRRGDNWRSLLSIAEAIGGEWPQRAAAAATKLTGKQDQDGIAALLLADIKAIFDGKEADALSSQELVAALTSLEDRPWPEWGRQRKPLTAPGLASQLRHFGIGPHQIWSDGQNHRGYRKRQFERVWERYLGPDGEKEPAPPMQNRWAAANGSSKPETSDAEPLGAETALAERKRQKSLEHAESSGLAVPQGEEGRGGAERPHEEVWDYRHPGGTP
jgi:putative DNA primase/helicase